MPLPSWLRACAFWKRPAVVTAPRPAAIEPSQIALGTVFTPSTPAMQSYVPRPTPEYDLKSALGQVGTQIVVFGESGAGKSSLAIRVLADVGRKYVITRCTSDMSYDDVLRSAFHQLNVITPTGERRTDDRHIGAKGGVPSIVEGSLDWTVGQEKDFSPVVAAPVTAEYLAQQMGRREMTWIIEDFHKVDRKTKTSLSHALKVFSDSSTSYPKTAIIVLGAADTSTEVWGSPANMGGRLAHIEVPPLTDGELKTLLDKGSSLLNVDFATVEQEIIDHSVGLASVTHSLAYVCCETLGVLTPASTQVAVTHQTLETAKESYSRTRSAEIKDAFEKALLVKRTRKFENHSIIVRALAGLGEKGGSHAEIYSAIKKDHPEYPSGNLTLYLQELQGEERGAVLRKTATGQFRFSKPLMHTYARQLFGINSGGAFWTGMKATQKEKESAVQSLASNSD